MQFAKIFKLKIIMPLIICIAILLYLLSVLFPDLSLYVNGDKYINVVIIDKTVPFDDFKEHKGLVMALKKNKIMDVDIRDYYGYIPEKNGYKIRQFKDIDEKPDFIYIADTIGVTKNKNGKEEQIIGGFNSDDMYQLRKLLKDNITVIGEYGVLMEPTAQNERKQLEDIFGVRSTKWRGKYFKHLDKIGEENQYIIRNYTLQKNQVWNFEAGGLVLLSSTGKVVVLEDNKDTKSSGLNIQDNIKFYSWFEIVEEMEGSTVMSYFTIDLTTNGSQKLLKEKIPSKFPAVVSKTGDDYYSYYFAGNFATAPLDNMILDNWLGLYMTKYLNWWGNDNSKFFLNYYCTIMEPILFNMSRQYAKPKNIKVIEETKNEDLEYKIQNDIKLNAKVESKKFQLSIYDKWQELFIKGVNIKIQSPLKNVWESADDPSLYFKWFRQISEMNANVIRIENLQMPSFYKALKDYNISVPKEKRIRIIQKILAPKIVDGNNKFDLDFAEQNKKGVRNVVNAIHGKIDVPKRLDGAWGNYSIDISDYVIAFEVAVDIDNKQVDSINNTNIGFVHNGRYIWAESGTPIENIIGELMDYCVGYESDNYGWQHPLTVSRSLDMKVDFNSFTTKPSYIAGFFGSMVSGSKEIESLSKNNKYPILINQFGFATGTSSNALTEEEQGKKIVNNMKKIKEAGYLGGLISDWTDVWNSKYYMQLPSLLVENDSNRKKMWHNIEDPIENMGIVAITGDRKNKENNFYILDTGIIKQTTINFDEEYFYIEVFIKNAKKIMQSNVLSIGIDIYDRKKGKFEFYENFETKSTVGMEYIAQIQQNNAILRTVGDGLATQSMKDLRIGDFSDTRNLCYIGSNNFKIRLPWSSIGFFDPSNLRVIDSSGNLILSDGFMINAILIGKQTRIVKDIFPGEKSFRSELFTPKGWEEQEFREKFKKSYYIIQEYFKSISYNFTNVEVKKPISISPFFEGE